ncbi:unnamed protein product [Amoebophrya sp. A120]|nr:unnamed protein product [Amoebophrya sp. A120]|eukprot:GSA120T00004826001.1
MTMLRKSSVWAALWLLGCCTRSCSASGAQGFAAVGGGPSRRDPQDVGVDFLTRQFPWLAMTDTSPVRQQIGLDTRNARSSSCPTTGERSTPRFGTPAADKNRRRSRSLTQTRTQDTRTAPVVLPGQTLQGVVPRSGSRGRGGPTRSSTSRCSSSRSRLHSRSASAQRRPAEQQSQPASSYAAHPDGELMGMEQPAAPSDQGLPASMLDHALGDQALRFSAALYAPSAPPPPADPGALGHDGLVSDQTVEPLPDGQSGESEEYPVPEELSEFAVYVIDNSPSMWKDDDDVQAKEVDYVQFQEDQEQDPEKWYESDVIGLRIDVTKQWNELQSKVEQIARFNILRRMPALYLMLNRRNDSDEQPQGGASQSPSFGQWQEDIDFVFIHASDEHAAEDGRKRLRKMLRDQYQSNHGEGTPLNVMTRAIATWLTGVNEMKVNNKYREEGEHLRRTNADLPYGREEYSLDFDIDLSDGGQKNNKQVFEWLEEQGLMTPVQEKEIRRRQNNRVTPGHIPVRDAHERLPRHLTQLQQEKNVPKALIFGSPLLQNLQTDLFGNPNNRVKTCTIVFLTDGEPEDGIKYLYDAANQKIGMGSLAHVGPAVDGDDLLKKEHSLEEFKDSLVATSLLGHRSGLKFFFTVVLCTGKEDVVENYNELDTKVKKLGEGAQFALDVVDDFFSESKEVRAKNPFLVYSLHLHIARMAGWNAPHNVGDKLDETRFSLQNPQEDAKYMKALLQSVFGEAEMKAVGTPGTQRWYEKLQEVSKKARRVYNILPYPEERDALMNFALRSTLHFRQAVATGVSLVLPTPSVDSFLAAQRQKVAEFSREGVSDYAAKFRKVYMDENRHVDSIEASGAVQFENLRQWCEGGMREPLNFNALDSIVSADCRGASTASLLRCGSRNTGGATARPPPGVAPEETSQREFPRAWRDGRTPIHAKMLTSEELQILSSKEKDRKTERMKEEATAKRQATYRVRMLEQPPYPFWFKAERPFQLKQTLPEPDVEQP